MKSAKVFARLLGAGLLLVGITTADAQERARADLKDAEGKSVGVATLQEEQDGVRVSVQIKGLAAGIHGIHIHAVGKCEAPKFASAGGHFNPAGKRHGFKSADGPHAGDLANLYVTSVGAIYETVSKAVTLKAGAASLFDADGSAIVIHAVADDYATDPAGNSGDRVACGVITKLAAKK